MELDRETLAQLNPDMLFADGLEKALIGVILRGEKLVALYSAEKCVKEFMEQGMSEEEAIEFFEFNTLGAYVGENTPIFINTEEEEEDLREFVSEKI